MGRTLLCGVSALALALVSVALGTVGGLPLQAANAVPGVPSAPVVLYSENFENSPDSGSPRKLTDYVSASPQYLGGKYTADSFWADTSRCNGFIVSSGNSYPGGGACSNDTGSFTNLRALAPILGTIGGTDTATNSIVAAYTSGGNGTANQVEFATVTPVALATPSRYLTFSVDAAGRNCTLAPSSHPRLQFSVKSSLGVETPLGSVIDPCDLGDSRTHDFGSTIHGGHYAASGSFLATGASVGIVMRNLTGTGTGNDGAFDNIQILDGTPHLDKSFGAPDPITGASTLTLTLTNTSDLATKLGWSALDTLAPGLVVANPANAATTCTNGTVTAASGSNGITIKGDLAGDTAHLTSCSFSIDVVPSAPTAQRAPAQVFQNCATNLSAVVGIDPPAVCATGSFPPAARLSVVKTSTATADTREGDIIGYSITATNTGGSAYTATSPAMVSDNLAGVLDDATYNNNATATAPGAPTYTSPNLTWSGPLAVGASVTISYTMTATLAGDGILANTACVPTTQASAAPCATTTTTVTKAPSIDLVKSADPSDALHTAGQTITYSFLFTNTGNLALANPGVTEESFNGADAMSPVSCPPILTLAPGAQMTCSATYTLVQADIDDRSFASPLVNSAVASAVASNGTRVISPIRSAQIPAIPVPGISLDKTAGPGMFNAQGQIVTYSFVITNTGNVTLHDAGITEGDFSGTGSLSAPVCPPAAASMLPGAHVTCTADYALTQADVDTGSVTNTAEASATPPSGPSVISPPDDATVPIAPSPAITLIKSAGPGGFTHSGQVVDYTFAIQNTGNVTLSDTGVAEVAFSGSGTVSTPSCAPLTLAPMGTATCRADYTLTQADVDSGVVSNTAISSGRTPKGIVIDSTPSDAVVTITPDSALSLTKSVDHTAVSGGGAQVLYSFAVTNTGQSTLTGLSITDNLFSGTGVLAAASCPTTSLAPGESTTCTTGYRITPADAATGTVTNTATASALDPHGVDVPSDPSSAKVIVDPVAAALAATGSASVRASATAAGSLLIAGFAVLAVYGWRRRRTHSAA